MPRQPGWYDFLEWFPWQPGDDLAPVFIHESHFAMTSDYFFKGWEPLIRILVVGTAFYFILMVMLRITGKRSLSRFDAFDFTITMAIGSIFGRVAIDEKVSLAEAVLAAALLVSLQFVLSWLAVRSSWVRKAICAEPTLLFYQGMYQRAAMKKERVTEEEIRGAMHEHGINDESQAEAVILGSNGKLAVVIKQVTPVYAQ
jgi:uncharacterized membrane protein YcaP (DUF421 family)